MQDVDAVTRRGAIGLVMLAVPIVSIVVIGAAYILLYSYGATGRGASEQRVRMTFDTCPEAAPVLEARVRWMGLPDASVASVEGGVAVEAGLPLARPQADAPRDTVPASLATRGVFTVRTGDDGDVLVGADAVEDATVELNFLDTPHAIVQLDEAGTRTLREHMQGHTDDHVSFWIDDDRVGRHKNLPGIDDGRISLTLDGEVSDLARVDFVAHAALVVGRGPVPCPIAVRAVEDVAP